MSKSPKDTHFFLFYFFDLNKNHYFCNIINMRNEIEECYLWKRQLYLEES